jgi:hypothetical protein
LTPVLVVIAIVVAAGAVAAVSAPDHRVAAIGTAVALLGAGLVAEPLPATTAVAAQIVASGLAGYLAWVAVRDAPEAAGSAPFQWPGAAAVAIVAFVAGWLAAGAIGHALAGTSTEGPSLAGVGAALADGSPGARAGLGGAFALVALAIVPVAMARDVLRLGLGLLLLVAAVEMLRAALVGRPDDMVTLAFAIVFAVGGTAVVALVMRSLRLHGDLELRATAAREAAVRSHVTDEAHPAGRRR